MPLPEPSFSIGVEEEYMLVDLGSRDLVAEPPPELTTALEDRLGKQFSRELLRTQLEVGTKVCGDIGELREDLSRLRATVASIAGQFAMAPIASSTHPFANWRLQKVTDRERYQTLGDDLQVVASRALIGGMHVHVGIEDDDLRIDLLNQLTYFLPHLLAASTSSPFWEGALTGLMSYRTSVFSELPRTGPPEQFESYADYVQTVAVLQDAGLIEDASKIWWDARLSKSFPTIELRATDICTDIEDAICLAAVYRCVLRMLTRLRRANQRWRRYSPLLIRENRWRAQRYGIDAGLVDFGQGEIKPFPDLGEELLELIAPDAEYFGCVSEVEHLRTIVGRGTSAHQQIGVYRAALADGDSDEVAFSRVVDHLVATTAAGLGPHDPAVRPGPGRS